MGDPLSATREDDFVGRVLWALEDKTGFPARRFAELDPVPSLDWLVPLGTNRYRHDDLPRFDVSAKTEQPDKLAFSHTSRPAPYALAPRMALVDGGDAVQWDDRMSYLARWLTRHLDDPALILWFAKLGSKPHPLFVSAVERRIDELVALETQGKSDKLSAIREAAPRAIPRPMLRTLWRLLLSGCIKSRDHHFDLYQWQGRLMRDGLTPDLRLALRQLLAPCIVLREPFRWDADDPDETSPGQLNEIVDWELGLRCEDVRSMLHESRDSGAWLAALADLVPDVSILLRDGLDLLRELGGADDRNDSSFLHQPSIGHHPQNMGFKDWTALIELARDGWIALSQRSPEQARLAAEQWRQIPYPLFKRLAFFAATHASVISPGVALDWLLADQGWWLWSMETQREAMRLLVSLSPRLESGELSRLENAILQGPPRSMFKDDLDSADWARVCDRERWLRLAKMITHGVVLGTRAAMVRGELSTQYPQWQVDADEKDEFPVWAGSVSVGESENWRKFIVIPPRRRELVEYLRKHHSLSGGQTDNWRERCRNEFPVTACALYALTLEDIWSAERWREALQAWAEEKLLLRSWRYMAQVLVRAPDAMIHDVAHPLSRWLQALAGSVVGRQDLFFMLCRRILELPYSAAVDLDHPVTEAINHPVGQITEALLRWWYRRELADNQRLPCELEPFFTRLCDRRIPAYRHGRVLLGSDVVTLFRVDPEWAARHLLPHFDWQTSVPEARAVWEGYLWSPRLYRPLLERIKPAFLGTAAHYSDLGEHGRQYAPLLTYAALDPADTFTARELKSAIEALPKDGRAQAADTLVRALEAAGEQRAEYWHNRILPYWKTVWPKSSDDRTPVLSKTLARLCIAAREAFPESFDTLRDWLEPVEYTGSVLQLLNKEGLAKCYPDAALGFLDCIVGGNTHFSPGELRACLDDIKAAKAALALDDRFRRLFDYLRRYE